MKELEFHPHAETYPLLEGTEWEAFKADVEAHGIKEPIKVRQVGAKKQGLDGRNRLRASKELAIDCPEQLVKVEDSQVEYFIDSLNLHRRHLTKEQRLARVETMQANGHSVRTIAETLGVGKSTVQRDLAEVKKGDNKPPAESLKTGENKPPAESVVGASGSGKTKGDPKKSESESVPNGTPGKGKSTSKGGDSKKETGPLKDSEEQEIPPGLFTVFEKVADFKEIVNQLNSINRKLKELSEHAAGGCMRLQNAQIDLRNLKETVRFDTPYAVCPVCKGLAKSRKANCPCKQRGWLVETSYKNLPQEFRK